MHERISELLRESIRDQKPSWKNALSRAFASKMDPYWDVPDTFRDAEGREHTVLRDPRYKIPIALPTGIVNMLSGPRGYRSHKEGSRQRENRLTR